MAIPSRVQQVLEDWNVKYTLANKSPLYVSSAVFTMQGMTENAAQICVLEDDIGQVQVIFPATSLLDLNALYAATARQLSPVKPEEINKLKQRLQVTELPALPQLTGLDTYVDEALLGQNEISLHLGESEWLQVPQNDFQTLISSSRIGHYTAEIPHSRLPGSQWVQTDIVQINRAVKNFTERRIRQRLEETLDMPPLPETAQQIIQLRMDPNAETEQLSRIVERDPGLAAQVISWANSPYYGMSGGISSVKDAVVRVLGFDLVINLALGLALGRTLEVPKQGPTGYTPFWTNSVYTAALMSELVRAMPVKTRPSQGMAYLSGLLSSFGYLILAHVFPPHFRLVNRHVDANPHINRYFIEQHLLGISREQISSCLLKQWGLPEEVCTAIRYQNEPAYAEQHHQLARMLFIVQRMLRTKGIGGGPEAEMPLELMASIQMDEAKALAGLERVIEAEEALQAMARQLSRGG